MGQIFVRSSNSGTTLVVSRRVLRAGAVIAKIVPLPQGSAQKIMATTMKLKFAGFLRGLLRHIDDRSPARHVTPPTPPTAPVSPPVAPAQAPQNTFVAPVVECAPLNATEIQIPLAAVIAHLPMDLKAKLMSAPAAGQMVALAVETVLQQLAFGSVKISFGELRQLSPGMFANSGGAFDARQVSLPLPEILTRLNPALLARKPSQKIDVAEEISGPFDGRGRGITFTTQPLKPSAATPTVRELKPMNQPLPFTPSPIASAALPPRTVMPVQSGNTEVFTFTPRQTAPPSAPIPFNPPPSVTNGHGHTNGNGNSNGNGNTNLPPFKFTTAPAPSAPVNSSSPRPEPAQPTLLMSLDELADNWPDELKAELVRSNFASTNVALPMNFVEGGLKRGRVTMSWQALRTLAKPSSPASPHDALEVELSLKALAPAFFAAQKKTFGQKKLVVAEGIPNLFFGFPTGSPETEAQPAAAPVAPKPADTNFFTAGAGEVDTASIRKTAPQTDFLNRHTHPQEIVARALALPGVAGAVVTLVDGLRVASQVPETLNADAVAAFLPQIFERVNQTTRELRMGALNNVSFTVGNIPWKIFRVNSVYFAAFGRAGEALPKAQLAALAAELDRKQNI